MRNLTDLRDYCGSYAGEFATTADFDPSITFEEHCALSDDAERHHTDPFSHAAYDCMLHQTLLALTGALERF